MVVNNRINITEGNNLNNTVHNTINIFYSEKEVNTTENINATVAEYMNKSDNTTTLMNARNKAKLSIKELNNTMNSTNSNMFINLKTSKNVTNLENNCTLITTLTTRPNEIGNSTIQNQNTTSNNTFSSIGKKHNITENSSHLDIIYIISHTQTNDSSNNYITNENVKSITEQNMKTDDSITLHTNKIIHATDTSVTNTINNFDRDTEFNSDEQSITVTNAIQRDTAIPEETITKTNIIIHESTSDTIFTESYMASTITTENEDDWIFTEEEEDDDSIILEMPSIASDPMALKELPRPIIFQDEESATGLV